MTGLPFALVLVLLGAGCASPAGQGKDGAPQTPADAAGQAQRQGDDGPATDAAIAPDTATDAAIAPDTAKDGSSADGPAASCSPVGAACTTNEDPQCSSGDGVEIACRSYRVCSDGRWQPAQSFLAPCQAGGPGACPASAPVPGGVCTVHAQLCSYPSGTSCACVSDCASGVDAGVCNRPFTWTCNVANLSAGSLCPPRAPQLGDPCGDQPVQCQYGPTCAAYGIECKSGRWQLGAIGGCG
jgi:hypothetical protein